MGKQKQGMLRAKPTAYSCMPLGLLLVCSVLGLDVSRQEPVPPERVHKMRGITTVAASAEVREGRREGRCEPVGTDRAVCFTQCGNACMATADPC